MKRPGRQVDIAVIGVGAICPHAENSTIFWQNILSGRDSIKDIPENRWLIADYFNENPNAEDQVYCKRGAFLEDIPFDSLEFGIPPANLAVTDTTQLLALIATKQTLQDAAQDVSYANVPLQKASIILGVTSAQELLVSMSARIQKPIWRKALQNIGLSAEQIEKVCQSISDQYAPWQENTFPGLLGNVVSGRVANRFNFGGTNCVTDAACASSFSALSMGINELLLEKSDLVITGGADTLNDIFMYMCFGKTKALSFSGKCAPFSENSDGTLLGEAICLFALKRLEDAENNNDKIYAVIKGIGSSSDGYAKSIYAPLARGQAQALRRAYEDANYTPDTVQLVEAHGTGTKAGDSEEVKALVEVFRQFSKDQLWCALGSIKSQIGHTKATAGAVGLFKIIMALRHKVFPPTINVEKPNSALNFENSPFYLNTRTRPWIKSSEEVPRRASVSSFGFGGVNFHITAEEYKKPAHLHGRLRTFHQELIVLSGDSSEEILNQLTQWQNHKVLSFFTIAHESQLNFNATQNCRLAFIVDCQKNLLEQLNAVKKKILEKVSADSLKASHIFYSEKNVNSKIAFLFTGQGSQRLYMGDELAIHFDAARNIWDEMAAIKLDGKNTVADLVFPPAPFTHEDKIILEEKLNQTEWSQPALAANAFAQFNLLKSLGITADYMIGHSFGEFIAVTAAGLMDLKTLVKLSWIRGVTIKKHVKDHGEMLAVINPIEETVEKIKSWNIAVSIANLNSPTQCVVSGSHEAIHHFQQLLSQNNITSTILKTGFAFHSTHMQPAADAFKKYLEEINFDPLVIPVLNNQDASLFTPEHNQQIEYLANHMVTPVNFIKQVQTLYEEGVRIFIEIGPKKILSSLVKQILPDSNITTVSMGEHQSNETLALWEVLGQLSAQGVALNFKNLWKEYSEKEYPPPAQYSANTVNITGSNYHKPYPPGEFKDLNISSAASPAIVENDSDHKEKEHELIKWANEAEHRLNKLYQEFEEKMQTEKRFFIDKMNLTKNEVEITPSVELKSVVSSTIHSASTAANVSEMHHTTEVGQAVNSTILKKTFELPSVAPAISLAENKSSFTPAKPVEEVPVNKVGSSSESLASADLAPASALAPASNVKTPANNVLEEKMIAIVADKTGFNCEIIKVEMSLEADLGIDSIKRVEILAELRKSMPDLPAVEPSEISTLETIKEIAAFFNEKKK